MVGVTNRLISSGIRIKTMTLKSPREAVPFKSDFVNWFSCLLCMKLLNKKLFLAIPATSDIKKHQKVYLHQIVFPSRKKYLWKERNN